MTIYTISNPFMRSIALCTLLVASSCTRNILETVPETSISGLNAFDTPERILAQVNGLYSSIKNSQLYGGRYIIYQELRADEFILNKPNAQTGQITWGHNVNSSTAEVQNMWSAAYGTINSVHLFLEGLEANQDKLSGDLYNNYLGEAKLLRALSYFVLVQQYARPFIEDNGASKGLPMRLIAEKSGENNDLPRGTVAEVYDQILSDLNEAETLLPRDYENATLNTTRAHQNTAIALKTRVYLTMGRYAEVQVEAAKIVSAIAPYQSGSGVDHQLEPDITQVFLGGYTGKEAIFSLPMNAQDAPGGQNALSYYFTFTPGNAEYYLNPAGTLADPVFSLESVDARKALVIMQQDLPWLYKFKTPSPYIDFIPVIRYAEVILNYSEAAARSGNDALALELVSSIRFRSDADHIFAQEKIASSEAVLNTIMQERRIELFGEGFRVPDLQRTLQPLPSKTGPAGSSPGVEVNESKYIWPIPANELSTNRLIEPNP